MTWLDDLLHEAQAPAPAQPDKDLERLCAGLPPEDARALREERAGILEFEAGMPREEAELRAGLHRSPAPRRCA